MSSSSGINSSTRCNHFKSPSSSISFHENRLISDIIAIQGTSFLVFWFFVITILHYRGSFFDSFFNGVRFSIFACYPFKPTTKALIFGVKSFLIFPSAFL